MFPKGFEKFASGRLAFGLASRLPKRAAGVGFVTISLLGRPRAAGQSQESSGSALLPQTGSSSLLFPNNYPQSAKPSPLAKNNPPEALRTRSQLGVSAGGFGLSLLR